MKKWMLILIIFMMMIPIAIALLECQPVMTQNDIPCMIISSWPYANCNTTEMIIYDSEPSLISTRNFTEYLPTTLCNTTWNITERDTYLWNVSNGDSGHIIIQAGDDEMASLGITIFILMITGTIFWFAFKKDLHPNKYANLVIKRALLVLGIFLMILNSAIMATIAEAAGLELTQEMFFFMKLFSLAGYPIILFLMLSTLFQSFREMKIDKQNKRTGDVDDD